MTTLIPLNVSASAQRVLDALGRTEDVKLSPSNRRLAVASVRHQDVVVFDLSIETHSGSTQVTLSAPVKLKSSTLRYPHGLSFLDDNTLAVGNRGGDVCVYAVPQGTDDGLEVDAAPELTIRGDENCVVRSPGSLSVTPIGPNRWDLLVCNNYVHHVSRHLIEKRDGLSASSHAVLLRKDLDVPDGIAVSAAGSWIAISNHTTHCVFVYANLPALDRDSRPDAVLIGVDSPHGVRFTADGKHILVADAGAPFINVYSRGSGGWTGTLEPTKLFRSMDASTFKRGRHNPEEGGPKGIDVDDGMRVLVATCEHLGVVFFDLPFILNEPAERVHLGLLIARRSFERARYKLVCRVKVKLKRIAGRM